jgi:tetrathionate reductase subunit B
MAKVFLVDIAKCSGCYNCQLACKDEHVGNDWTPYAKPQPKIGQFWIKVLENIGGTIPKVKIHYMPRLCNHCENASCIDACPTDALYRRDDGLVILDPEKCNGCKDCIDACPYDVIYFNDEQNIAQKCTGCAHLLDHGHELPRCVDVCPTQALRFGDEEDFEDIIMGSTVMKPETGNRPRVYYQNVPGKFIAGTVYDPEAKEIIEGAKCHLNTGPRVWDVWTDDFGDFWFKDLPISKFDLTITADGYEPVIIRDIGTAEDRNLGDIPMTAKKE